MTVRISPDTQFSLELSVLSGKAADDGRHHRRQHRAEGGEARLRAGRARQDRLDLHGGEGDSLHRDGAAHRRRPRHLRRGGCPRAPTTRARTCTRSPGTVVEKRPGELYSTAPVAAAALASYRPGGAADRAEFAAEERAEARPRQRAALRGPLARLTAARAELERNKRALAKWKDENRHGRVGQRAELKRERAVHRGGAGAHAAHPVPAGTRLVPPGAPAGAPRPGRRRWRAGRRGDHGAVLCADRPRARTESTKPSPRRGSWPSSTRSAAAESFPSPGHGKGRPLPRGCATGRPLLVQSSWDKRPRRSPFPSPGRRNGSS